MTISNITTSLIRLFIMLVCMFTTDLFLSNPYFGAFLFLGAEIVIVGLFSSRPPVGSFQSVPSYHLFSQVVLFSTAAMELSVMIMISRILTAQPGESWWHRYAVMGVWMIVVGAAGLIFRRFVQGKWRKFALAEFMIGALLWVVAEVLMLRSAGTLLELVWSIVWICAIVLVSAALDWIGCDFEAIGFIDSHDLGAADLRESNRFQQRRTQLVSAGIMLMVMALWLWLKPVLSQGEQPRMLFLLMVNLPLLLMLIAIGYAIRFPLDHRNREKLMNYLGSKDMRPQVKQSLQRMLGHHAPFGTRLICWLALPWFRHRVVGREHLKPEHYPSVFVCNHGFLYGPIVASLYLPTYFRPWIHDRMLNEDKATLELAASFPWVRRLIGRKAAMRIYRFFAHLVVKLLLSFRPIPVVRGTSHDAITTFDHSLKALEEGDNLLLFPEKPKRLANQPGADLRNFYTGFAHLGKLYYDATQRPLLFYPIYSDHHTRRFIIGEPVPYDTTLPPRDSKRAIAEQLQARMEAIIATTTKEKNL